MSVAIQGVAFLIWSADRDKLECAATPFVMAQAAVALGQQVEMYFTAQAVQLLTPAAGELHAGFGPQRRALRDYLQQVHELSIPLYACAQALHALDLQREALIPLCSGLGGSVQYMARVADPAWRGLVF